MSSDIDRIIHLGAIAQKLASMNEYELGAVRAHLDPEFRPHFEERYGEKADPHTEVDDDFWQPIMDVAYAIDGNTRDYQQQALADLHQRIEGFFVGHPELEMREGTSVSLDVFAMQAVRRLIASVVRTGAEPLSSEQRLAIIADRRRRIEAVEAAGGPYEDIDLGDGRTARVPVDRRGHSARRVANPGARPAKKRAPENDPRRGRR